MKNNTDDKFLKRKTLNFGEDDKGLYDFCKSNSEDKGIKFATYIKQILREKMNESELTLEEKIDKRIEKYFKNKEIKLEGKDPTAATDENKIEYTKQDVNALKAFME